jgi:hypothetical protein
MQREREVVHEESRGLLRARERRQQQLADAVHGVVAHVLVRGQAQPQVRLCAQLVRDRIQACLRQIEVQGVEAIAQVRDPQALQVVDRDGARLERGVRRQLAVDPECLVGEGRSCKTVRYAECTS